MPAPYFPDLLERPVPRYTSYPTAADFVDFDGPGRQAELLTGLDGAQPLSLYVHIPFCREICWYCGCATGAANRAHRLELYLDRLVQEAALVGQMLAPGVRIERVAFGGGSPNAIGADQFDSLVASLASHLPIDGAATLSVEVDPRGFDRSWAAALGRNRVTRVSLGVQTFDPAVQAAIGRVQPLDLIDRTVMRLRAVGIDSLNFDLMYGLPGQDMASLEATLAQAIGMTPDRLAIFGYAHVPDLIPRQRRIDAGALPDAAARFAQAVMARKTMTAAGWQAVGFDHFARPGDAIAVAARLGRLRRNFQGFTEDPAPVLLGIGASAITSAPGLIIQNEKNAGRWGARVAAGQLAGVRGAVRSLADRRHGAVIDGLLCHGAADLALAGGVPAYADALAPFLDRGLATLAGTRLQLAPDAWPYARAIAAIFDSYRPQSARRFSSAV